MRIVIKSLLLSLAVIFASAACAQTAPTKTISGGVVNGKAISLPQPEYPEDARKNKVAGTVKVEVLIDETGKVVSAHAIGRLDDASLRASAEAAAMKSTFAPTLMSGSPVKVSGEINYNFVAADGYEEQLKAMVVPFLLRTARSFAFDLDKFNAALESKDIFEEAGHDFPKLTSEFAELSSLEKVPSDKRIAAIDKASSAIRSKLEGPEKWQFEVGENFAEMFDPLFVQMTSGVDKPDISKLDEHTVKLNLNKIRDLTNSAPDGFPKEVLEKLKALAALGEKDHPLNRESSQEFLEKMDAVFETITPRER